MRTNCTTVFHIPWAGLLREFRAGTATRTIQKSNPLNAFKKSLLCDIYVLLLYFVAYL